jgi:hypothetical protein
MRVRFVEGKGSVNVVESAFNFIKTGVSAFRFLTKDLPSYQREGTPFRMSFYEVRRNMDVLKFAPSSIPLGDMFLFCPESLEYKYGFKSSFHLPQGQTDAVSFKLGYEKEVSFNLVLDEEYFDLRKDTLSRLGQSAVSVLGFWETSKEIHNVLARLYNIVLTTGLVKTAPVKTKVGQVIDFLEAFANVEGYITIEVGDFGVSVGNKQDKYVLRDLNIKAEKFNSDFYVVRAFVTLSLVKGVPFSYYLRERKVMK